MDHAFAARARHSEPAAPTRRSRAGALGVGLGVAAILVGLVPVLGLAMLVPAAGAVLLGLVGLVKATATGRTSIKLPVLATALGAAGMVTPLVSTAAVAVVAAPQMAGFVADQAQVDLEFDLRAAGVGDRRAAVLAERLSDGLRHYAHPADWPAAVTAVHRLGRTMEAYEDGHRTRPQTLADLQRLADDAGVDVGAADLDLLLGLAEARPCPTFGCR